MKVLFLTHRLPYAPNRGDRIRAYHMLRVMAAHADVDLVSLVHDAEEQAHVGDFGESVRVFPARVPRIWKYVRGVRTLCTARPLTHALLDSHVIRPILRHIVAERRPDIVFAYCSSMARYAVEPPLADIPFVLDMMDVDSEKWAALAFTATSPRRWIYRREASCLSRFEVQAVRRAVTTFVVNEKERVVLARMAPGADIVVLPNGIDVDSFRSVDGPSTSLRVVFCGVMNYGPNVEAALWLARHVWPNVRSRVAGARLMLVGSNPVPEVRQLAAEDSTIEVTGTVPDVRTYLWDAAVGVAPLLTARGIQNKVLEAVAAGLPTVVTPAVAEGLPVEALNACAVAAGPEVFADRIVDLLRTSAEDRHVRAARAELGSLTWPEQLSGLMPVLERAARAAAEPAANRRAMPVQW